MKRFKKYLKIALYNKNDPLLQSVLPPLDLENSTPTLKKDVELLKRTASYFQVVSLSANQVDLKHRMFAIIKEPYIKNGLWSGYDQRPEDYQIIVNPERVGESNLRFKDFEECPSIPGMRFAIWNPIVQTYRFHKVKENTDQFIFQEEERTLRGFVARLWDHECRHLDGLLALA